MKTGIDCKGTKWYEVSLNKAKDLSNQTFNYWTALFRVNKEGVTDKRTYWLCQCKCGNQQVVDKYALTSNHSKSCGCYKREQSSERLREDLTGRRYGRLLVEEYAYSNGRYAIWKCLCDCGNHAFVSSENLKNGDTKSCGCLFQEYLHSRALDLIGKQCANLYVENRDYSQNWDRPTYKCKCICGNYTLANSKQLSSGSKTSCGCRGGMSGGEAKIAQILNENQIPFLYDTGYFKDLKLPSNKIGRYDFILLDKNNNPFRLIEFDGIQHYYPTKFSSHLDVEDSFQKTKMRDKVKNQYALDNNLPLVRIPYTYIKNIDLDMLLGDQFLVKQTSIDE